MTIKVLLLAQMYSDKPVSGGVRIVWDYSQELARQGAKVYVVANNIDTDNLPKHPNLKIYKVPFSSYETEPVNHDVLKSFFYSIPIILFYRIKIIHMVTTQSPCPFSLFKFGAKFIEAAEETWDYNDRKFQDYLFKDRHRKEPPKFSLFDKFFLRFSKFFYWLLQINQRFPKGSDAFFCRSKLMFDYLRHDHGIKSKFYYMPNAVDTSHFKPVKKQATDKFIFLASGSLSYRKGTHFLINAYNEFSKKYENKTELWLIGNSHPQTLLELKKLIKIESIKLINAVKPSEINKYYNQCDVCISLALVAELGTLQANTLEAMASGRPLIVTEYGFTRDLEKGEIVLTCRPNEPVSVVSAMEKVFLDYNLRHKLSRNALKYVKDEHDWVVVTKNCLSYYQDLLDNHNKLNMYIFQPDRYLLKQQIKKFGHYITGKTLDIGAGDFSRYKKFFKTDEYLKMDINNADNLDIVGSADNIPLADNFCDSVVSTQVFEHLKNPFKAADEIFRILKPGGICLLTIPQWNELHEEPNDYYRYTKFGIMEIFETRGFETMVIDRRGGFFTMIFQIKVRYLLDRFHLHNRKFIGRIFSRLFKIGTILVIWLDHLDKSEANQKHTIGWLFILRKK